MATLSMPALLCMYQGVKFTTPLSEHLPRSGTDTLAAAAQPAGAAQHAASGRLTRPTGVSKIDLLTVWGGPGALGAAPGAAARMSMQAAGSKRGHDAWEHGSHRLPRTVCILSATQAS